MRKISGIRCFSTSSSRKLTSSGSAPVIAALEPLLLLRRGEVGAEEEDLQLAIAVDGVGELAELLLQRVQLALVAGPPRRGPRRIRELRRPSLALLRPRRRREVDLAERLLDEAFLVVVVERFAGHPLGGEHAAETAVVAVEVLATVGYPALLPLASRVMVLP